MFYHYRNRRTGDMRTTGALADRAESAIGCAPHYPWAWEFIGTSSYCDKLSTSGPTRVDATEVAAYEEWANARHEIAIAEAREWCAANNIPFRG